MLKSGLIKEINKEYDELINMQEIVMRISDRNMNEILNYLQESGYLNNGDKMESLLHTIFICYQVRPGRRKEITLLTKEIKPRIKYYYTDSEVSHLIRSYSLKKDVFHYEKFMNIYMQKEDSSDEYTFSIIKIILSDDIDQFQDYIAKNNKSLDEELPINILGHKSTYLSLSMLFNSVKISNFLRMNNAKIRVYDRIFAIAGGNYDLIHYSYDSFPDEPKEIELSAAIQFHQNQVAVWLHENYRIEYSTHSIDSSIQFYNPYMVKELKELKLFNPIQYLNRASLFSCYEIFTYFLTFLKKSKEAPEIQIFLNLSFNEASKSGAFRIVYFLLENELVSKNIDTIIYKKLKKSNPITLAAKHGNLKVLDVFLYFKNKNLINFDLNCKTNLNMTPLHLAVKNQKLDVVMFLASCEEVNLNDQCLIGWTPLHFAVDQEETEIVRFLCSLNEKVDVNIKDRFGERPIDLAKKNRLYEIELILRAHCK